MALTHTPALEAETAQTASQAPASPWLKPDEAAAYARCSTKAIYRAVSSGQLKAARLMGGRQIRLRAEWIDAWLYATVNPA